jgi:Mce-associated membrane protein
MSSDESRDEVQEVPGRPEPESTLSRYLVLGTAGLAAAALIVAAVFGIQWWSASGDDNLALAKARDQVVQQGAVAVKAFTELDYTNPDALFQKQIDLSTGNFQTQLKNSEQTYRQALADAKTKVTTTVQDIGVEELDQHQGKATFLAAISTRVVRDGQQPAIKPLRLEVTMARVGQDWKVADMGSVPLISGGQ